MMPEKRQVKIGSGAAFCHGKPIINKLRTKAYEIQKNVLVDVVHMFSLSAKRQGLN